MGNWLRFLQERLATPFIVVIALGLSLSGMFFLHGGFEVLPFVFSFAGTLLLFIQYRLITELKHFDTGSGVTAAEATGLVFRIQLVLYAYGLIVWVLFSQTAAFNFMLAAVYLWHIFKDFFVPDWMNRHLLASAFAKQLVFLPIALFVTAMGNHPMDLAAFSFAQLLFGAFYIFEICGNLNPQAHPVHPTYVHYYGYHKLFFYVLMALLLTCIAALSLGLAWLLWPMLFLVLATMVILYFQSSKYYWLQNAAFMLLIASCWVVVIVKVFSFV